MGVTIKYFGAIEEVTEVSSEVVSIEEISSVEDLKNYSLSRYPKIKGLSFQIAVNQTLTNSGKLKEGDEIAFLPPFAGG